LILKWAQCYDFLSMFLVCILKNELIAIMGFIGMMKFELDSLNN
jgi:hypothetical protein